MTPAQRGDRLPFVVIGESLVDVVLTRNGSRVEAVGGSPMNVAVGLARLDVPSLLLTRLGDDPHGLQVVEHVRASGVDLPVAAVVPGARTSTATALLDEQHAAAYEFDLTWDLPAQPLPAARGVHVGSLGAVLPPGRETVAELAAAAAAEELFVSYDPNIRPAFLTDPAAGWRDATLLAAECRLVKLSDEDAALLRPGRPLEEVAAELLAGKHTELVLLTRGGAGASAYGDGFAVHRPAPAIEVVDTVGAGDSFMAATLAVLDDWDLLEPGAGRLTALSEARLTTLLDAALSAAAITCSRRGANPPWRAELAPTWPVT